MIAEFDATPTLFDPQVIALHRASDPDTSRNAAVAVTPRVAYLEGLVLDELRRRGPIGGTVHELADALDLSLVSVSPRMKPLELRRLVKRSGRRSGRTVWFAT